MIFKYSFNNSRSHYPFIIFRCLPQIDILDREMIAVHLQISARCRNIASRQHSPYLVSKLYSVFTVDAVTLPALQDSGLGILGTQTWSADIDNPVNKKFVADYKAKYGSYPSFMQHRPMIRF